jgi:1,4-dihydroxy-2-naphthoyl-CoA synthase
MCLEIEDAIDSWRNDDAVKLIMIDGAGDRAFCSGGDIVDMYASGQNSDLDYGRKFWRDEYRLNSKLAHYPKPIVTFLHGFTGLFAKIRRLPCQNALLVWSQMSAAPICLRVRLALLEPIWA